MWTCLRSLSRKCLRMARMLQPQQLSSSTVTDWDRREPEVDAQLRRDRRGGKKNVIKVPKDKQDTHSERVNYLNGNSNLCTLDKRTNRMSLCLCGFPLRLADVKLDVQQQKKTNSQERPKQEPCECLSAYGQELARWHKPQTGFLIRYMGHPYAASAKSM